MKDEKFITVITSYNEVKPDTKAGLPSFKKIAEKEIKISSEKLAQNLQDFLESFKPVLEKQETKLGKFVINEIELNLAINASGGIDLIGKLDVGIEGGITIKLQRQSE